MSLAGLILAGGRSSRFGSEKALAPLDGQPLIAHVAKVLVSQLGASPMLAVSAPATSGAADWARAQGLTVLSDPAGAPDGPLSGLREGLRWACAQGAGRLAVLPCDTPRLPPDVIATLEAGLRAGTGAGTGVALAETADGLQPLVGLWRCRPALAVLEGVMQDGSHPAVRSLLAPLAGVRVRFEAAALFANANRPQDLG